MKNIFKLLIIAMLAISANVCAANVAQPLTATADWQLAPKDSIRKNAKADKPKKEKKEKGDKSSRGTKKVTFESFDQNYEKALRFYNNKQYLSAAAIFEELYPLSLGTPRSDTVLYLFADCYYRNKDYSMAALHFRDYVRRFPSSDRTEDAFYYCISAIYNTSPEYYLDQSNTEYAIEQIKTFVQAYPENKHIEECNQMLDELRLKLARKKVEILKLYYDTDHYEACQVASKTFFNEYAYSPLMPEAIYYLVLNNFEYARKSVEAKKQERLQACLDACIKMELDYPNCSYVKEVQKIESEVRKQLEKYGKPENL